MHTVRIFTYQQIHDNLDSLWQDPDETPDSTVEYLLLSSTDELRAAAADKGFIINNENKTVTTTAEAILWLKSAAVAIMHEYDHPNTPHWDLYGLSGDDDVDYNGGFIFAVCKSLEKLWSLK